MTSRYTVFWQFITARLTSSGWAARLLARRWLGPWVLGLGLVALIGMTSTPGATQPSQDGYMGNLSLSIDDAYTVQVSLSTASDPAAVTLPWNQMVAQAFNCDPASVEVYGAEGWLDVSATCDRSLQRQGWRATGTFDFSPILAGLRQVGVSQITLNLSHQAMGFVELTPELIRSEYGGLGYRDGYLLHTTVLLVEQPALTQLALVLGYRASDVAQILALPVAVLLLPLILVVVMRQNALRQPPQDSAPIWFGYQRSLNWVVMGLWIGWFSVSIDSHLHRVVPLLLGEWSVFFQGPLHSVFFFVPPALVVVGCYALSHRVFRQIGQMDWSLWELIQQASLSQARVFLPLILFFLGIDALFNEQWGGALAWVVVAYVTHVVLTQWLVKALDMTAQAITMGELRDRIFALAQPAGVKLQQVYVLPMKRNRMANAFAVQGGNVMLTDYLLRHLSKREVDAVMAHELAHLQYGHPAALINVLIGGVVASAIILAIATVWVPWLPWLPISIVVGLLVFYFYSRRFEHQADLQAALLTGDPVGMMTGLVKVARLNSMPLQWGKWDESFLTHPSMRRRVEALARRFDVAIDTVEAVFNESDIATDHYSLPPAIASTEPIFSTSSKQAVSMRLLWSVIAIASLTPVLVAWNIPSHWPLGWQWAGYVGGIVLTIAVLLAALNWLSVLGYQQWGKQLRRRLEEAGIQVAGWQGTFVSLSPDAEPRLYEGFYDWDLGFLFVQGDRLCYVGEQVQFSLTVSQIEGITLGKAAPSWWRSPRIYIPWREHDQAPVKVFNLRPAWVPALHQLPLATRSLKHHLQDWWEHPTTTPVLAPLNLPTPAIGTVTSIAPRHALIPNLVFSLVILVTLLTLALGLALRLPLPHLIYAVSVAIATLLFQFWPLWRDRQT